MKLAAIDIGSNSIKLLVVNAVSSNSFVTIAREKEPVRLGHETLHNRRLSPEAIERAAETIKRYRSLAESRGAEKIYAVATATVRAAENAAEFIESVEAQTGVHVEVIPGVEEARLIGIAAATGCASESRNLLNIDIGGGSTEISVMHDGLPVKLFSVKLGAVGLTEKFILSDPPQTKEIFALQDEIISALERPTRELRGVNWETATGTSGTILAIGEIVSTKRKTDAPNNSKKDEKIISASALLEFTENLIKLNLDGRLASFNLTRQRAEIIIAGSYILRGVMKALKIDELSPCEYSLREGVIIDNLRKWEATAMPPIPDLQEPRLRGVLALAKRFNYEQEHSLQIARLAETIFDAVAEKHELDRSHRILLSAAALLHDIGYYISHEDHHKHSAYLINNSELTGFTEEQRNVIAAIARYHRGALPKEKHREMSVLTPHLREVVAKLSGILRLSDALDRSYDNRVKDLRVNFGSDGKINIKLESQKNCEREIQAAEQKRELFEVAFDCKLEIS